MVSIENYLKTQAKDKGINISAATEEGIKKELNMQTISPDDAICKFCDRKEELASKDNLKGMTWLCPDECWICSTCLTNEIEKLKITKH